MFPPLERYRDLTRPEADIAGLRLLGEHENAEHRRQIALALRELGAVVLASRPSPSRCTADTPVSSATFISVTGMAQSRFCSLHGDLGVSGVLWVQEDTPGEFSVRIKEGSTVVWSATVREQAALAIEGGQNGKWLVPIGGPGLVAAVGGSVYTLDVEIAAPSGAYTVLKGTGKESHVSSMLWPTLGVEA